MVDKVKIINVKTGAEIRTGSMRNNEISQTLIFGFLTLSDALKIGIAVFSIGVFLIKDNIRISSLEDGRKDMAAQIHDVQAKLADTTASLQAYMEASDGFHSALFGTQFKAGRPIDGAYRNHGNVVGEVSK